MNILALKDSLNNNVWNMSPDAFLAFKKKVDAISHDLTTYTTNNALDDDDLTPDAQGRVSINVTGQLLRGTGLSEGMADILGVTELDNLDQSLLAARDNPEIQTVVLYINSPGGTAHSYATALLVQELAIEKNVIGYVNAMCCSAAYMIASQCSELYCSGTAWGGFVGSIYTRIDTTQADEEDGTNYTFITSSPKKLYLNPRTTMSNDEQAWIQGVVMQSYEQFKGLVLANRNIGDPYLDSSIFIGQDLVTNNFFDGICNNTDELLKKISVS